MAIEKPVTIVTIVNEIGNANAGCRQGCLAIIEVIIYSFNELAPSPRIHCNWSDSYVLFIYFQIPQDNVGPGRPPREGEEEVVVTILEQSGISREIQ